MTFLNNGLNVCGVAFSWIFEISIFFLIVLYYGCNQIFVCLDRYSKSYSRVKMTIFTGVKNRSFFGRFSPPPSSQWRDCEWIIFKNGSNNSNSVFVCPNKEKPHIFVKSIPCRVLGIEAKDRLWAGEIKVDAIRWLEKNVPPTLGGAGVEPT